MPVDENRSARSFRHALRFCVRHSMLMVSGLLLLCSAFFFVRVEAFRRTIKSVETVSFKPGDRVNVHTVIDGDEVAVTGPRGGRTVVRLLGIKSFDPTRNDPLLSQAGQQAVNRLRALSEGKVMRLAFDKLTVDESGRTLAYLHRVDDNADIGELLIREGVVLVYTEYAFSREPEYLTAERATAKAGRGLWANDEVKARARALKALWDERRSRE